MSLRLGAAGTKKSRRASTATRAQALYRAQGFRAIEETPERLIMEWRHGG